MPAAKKPSPNLPSKKAAAKPGTSGTAGQGPRRLRQPSLNAAGQAGNVEIVVIDGSSAVERSAAETAMARALDAAPRSKPQMLRDQLIRKAHVGAKGEGKLVVLGETPAGNGLVYRVLAPMEVPSRLSGDLSMQAAKRSDKGHLGS